MQNTIRQGDFSALIVEDNWLIAMGLQNQLEQLGFRSVASCHSSLGALEYLNALTDTFPSLAVLDINLGSGDTSVPVASKLVELGVPFLFLSGQGANPEMTLQFPKVPTVLKPVTDDALAEKIHEILLLN